MAETPLTDAAANALSGTTDTDTEMIYPTIGKKPSYTAIYAMIERLLTLVKPLNALRVYKDGDDTFGVRAGKFQDESTTRTFAAVSEQSLTDDDTNYIYITDAGTLTVNITGFPDPAVTPHIPLATIAVGSESAAEESGLYAAEDITDYRTLALFTVLRG